MALLKIADIPALSKGWVRLGECNQCGQCCMQFAPCRYLKQQGEKHVCSIHDKRAEHGYLYCMQAPTCPEEIEDYPMCSFRFVWAEGT